MNPQTQCCHNPHCRARGQMGQGNIRVHSQSEQRYRCITCGHTFAATKSMPFYRLRTSAELVTIVLTLFCHECPTPAIVVAFGLDERTVTDWLTRTGVHGQQVHH
jgi:transposase-like protein